MTVTGLFSPGWYERGGALGPEPVLTTEQHERLSRAMTYKPPTIIGVGDRFTTVHKSKLRIWSDWADEDDDGFANWHWTIGHYEDGPYGSRTYLRTRWGSCNRWDDALEIGLAMLEKEGAEFWARVVDDVAVHGLRRIPQ